jgi:phosphoribosylanthranilate isomerase
MMVKICGIATQEDALAAVEAGAQAIGFNFYRDSPRYIAPTGAALIAEKLPADVIKVGVFVDETDEAIARIGIQVGLDVAQLYGATSSSTLRVWRAWPVAEGSDLSHVEDPVAEAFLLDGFTRGLYGGTGTTFPWALARGLNKKVIIAGGLDESNVEQAIEESRPWGVDACSRIEASPGKKDHEKMRRFIAAALRSGL